MRIICRPLFSILVFGLAITSGWAADNVKETALDAPDDVKIKIRMEGPITAETPLQIICLFKHKESGDKMLATAVDLDKDLHGAISSLRNRGEFVGDALETLLIVPPAGTIKPKLLLLIGIGDESSLSLERMEAVGRVAIREAARLGVSKIAFAPLIRDQGNSQFGTGDIGRYVIRGLLSAYDTDRRLQRESLAKPYTLEESSEEAGPAFFDDTVAGAKKAISEAKATTSERSNKPLENH
jgi:Cytosol aminopeptidase family, N-terminal domain